MYQVHNVYAICAFAAVGGGLFGFDIASMSGVLGTRAYTNYFHVDGHYRQGFINCSMPAASLVGTLGSSFIADRMSRKTAIQVAAVLWTIGSIFQSTSNGIPLLVVGRVVAGLGVGIASAMVPVYQAEIAPKDIRGRVVSLQQWAITWGILIQFFIQYGASFTGGGASNPEQGSAAFRIPWGVQILPALILFVGMFFLPYSPRWLASRDRWEESIRVLANLHGGGDIASARVLAQYQEINDALRFERENSQSSFRILTGERILKRVILGASVQVWSQLTGMNVMMYYIVYVMQAAGIGNPLLTASIQYVLNVASTLPAILFLDYWGRRPSLLFGSLSMMSLLFIIGALEALYGSPNPGTNSQLNAISWIVQDHPSVSKGIVACSYLVVCTFAVTWGPTSWTYVSEIYPSEIRAKAVSLATASNWAANCVLAFATPPLLQHINWKIYMIFAAFNGLAFIHMFLTMPETKGKTLEEMDDVFERGLPPWMAGPKGSRLDFLESEIKEGNVKVMGPVRRR